MRPQTQQDASFSEHLVSFVDRPDMTNLECYVAIVLAIDPMHETALTAGRDRVESPVSIAPKLGHDVVRKSDSVSARRLIASFARRERRPVSPPS